MTRTLVFVCLFVHLTTVAALAQTVNSTTGVINGKVTDSSGAVLPGVTVTLSGAAMMGTPTTVTSPEGLYRFVAVPSGEHRLAFELAGFNTVRREGIRVTIGFTATVNIELSVSGVQESVTVTGASPVVDAQATKVTTSFDAQTLANLPSARDYWAILAEAPAVRLTRIDVGGSAAGTQTAYLVYGTTGQNRPMVEGINSTEATGTFGNYVDYGSFEEIAIGTAAQGAEMAVPGVQAQFISKSGGNQYHGTFYSDYENQDWQSFNIDDDQIRRGVLGGGGLGPRDTNRVYRYHDVNVGVGGYIAKDRLWWFGALRDLDTQIRQNNFPVVPHRTRLSNVTAKMTYNLTQNNKLIGYWAPMRKWQPTRLDRNQLSSSVAFHTSVDSSYEEYFYPHVYKGEWNSVLNDGLFFEIRAGQYGYTRPDRKLTDAASFEDLGNSRVSGANRIADLNIRRNQVLGSLSYFKDGWAGNHNIKIGWEWFRETSTASEGDGSYNSVIHILRNGAPIEVYLLENPSTSENGMVALGAYINDTWKVSSRLSLNLGLRFDRYRNFLPEQEHPASRFNPTAIHFAGVDDLNTWSLFAPRVGATFDLAGNGKTVLKVNYGQYWWNPSYSLSSNVNPNPPQWSRRYAWTDPNRNGVWDPGEQGQLLATRGGVAGESLDPNLQDAFTREAVVWVEREVMPNFGVRTGVVWRGERQQYQRLNANQPYEAFNVPVSIPDPGPDGVRGNADDGPAISAFNLAAAYLTLAPSNVTRNVPNSDTNYYTWEVTATRRMSRRWSLLGTYSHTWSQAQNSQFFGTAFRQNNLPVTPNDLINAGPNGQIRFRDWSAKLHGTWEAPLGLKVTPVLRHQAGQSFGRTLSASTNYGSIRIPAEPITARRQDNVNILDVRLEKVVKLGPGARFAPFVDFFNMFNANAEQNITWSSGTSFLQPLSIVPPRLLRIGAKFEW